MKIEELLQRTIKDIKVEIALETYGMDTAQCYILLDNNLITNMPWPWEEASDEIWTEQAEEIAISIQKPLSSEYHHLINQRIVDLISFERSGMFDCAFIELQNGYLINQVTESMHGTGLVGLHFFESIQVVEAKWGSSYERLTDKIKSQA